MISLNPTLEAMYRDAEYVVYVEDQPIITRIDAACPPLANLLAGSGASSAVLLTACNPRSQPLETSENVRRQQHLCQQLEQLDVRWLSAVGRSINGLWQETSVLALDLAAEDALALCRQFEQHAWVSYDADGIGQLVVADLRRLTSPSEPNSGRSK